MLRLLPVALLSFMTAPAFASAPISGKWVTEDGKGIVEILQCGQPVCGRLVKTLVPVVGPPFDRNNPDPALRKRPLIGLEILSNFHEKGSKWEGTIYSPERGKSYRSVVYRNKEGTLTVKGCISFICETQTWKPLR
jgi:uncharacterized protein (DUF2147 family)